VTFTVAAATTQASQVIDGTGASSGGTLTATATGQSGLSVSGGSNKTFTMAAPPSSFSLAWSPTSGAYGTGSVLTATLDATAVNSTSLSIPLTSTISGVSPGSVTIVIGAGSTSGTYTLSGASVTGGTGGTVTTAATSQAAGGFALTFSGGQKTYTMSAVNEVALGQTQGGTASTSVVNNVNDYMRYTITGGVPNDTVSVTTFGNQPYDGGRIWPEGSTGPGGATSGNTFTLTLDANGSFDSGYTRYWIAAGTYTYRVTFAATGHTRSVIVTTYVPNVTIAYNPVGTGTSQYATSQVFGYSGVYVSNLNGTSTYPNGFAITLAFNTSLYTALSNSLSIASGNNGQYALARGHGTNIVATVTAQYCASTSLTVVVPAQVTYGGSNFRAEYGVTTSQYNGAANLIYPVYVTRSQYAGNLGTYYGIFRNPDAGGIFYWTNQAIASDGTYNVSVAAFYDTFFTAAAAEGTDARTGQTFGTAIPPIFSAGNSGETGYNLFSDRGQF
jgi:hypothetical protein